MKAVVYEKFGGREVLHVADLPEPTAADHEVIVAVEACSINLIDVKVRNGMMGPLVNSRFPKVPCADFAGSVVSTGRGVKGLRPGDQVFGAVDPFKGGAFAARVAAPAAQLAALPPGLSTSIAAALPIAGLAALFSVRDLGKVKAGQTVLIHGATGPVGLAAIQLAKLAGAQITAVAGVGLDTAKRLGADVIVDYRRGETMSFGSRFDVILNASGKLPYAVGKAWLKPDGRLIEPSPTIPLFIGSKLGNLFRRRKHLALATQPRRHDLTYLAQLVVDGKFSPVIAATFGFHEFLAAFDSVEQRGTVGKVIVRF